MKISVIVPTFNERENIVLLIGGIRKELRDHFYEILVVDDLSPDGTAQVVNELEDPHVRVLNRDKDRGFAKAIRYGIENATGDLLIIMDSDLNHDPEYLPLMVELLSKYECVSASRFIKGGKMVPAWRSWASGAFNAFIRRKTGSRLTDNLYGFFGFRKETLRNLPFDEIFFGFGDYGIRLLYFLQKRGIQIHEFPAVYHPRINGRVRGRYFRTLCQYIRETRVLASKGRLS